MTPNVHEIFEKFSKATTRSERKDVLLQNQFHYFKEVLKNTFNPDFKFYAENEFPKDYIKPDTFPGIREAGIESEVRKAYLFRVGDSVAESLTEKKRHQLLLQLLESFEPKEAEVFYNMLKKDLKVPYLTESLVRETFPELF